MLEFFSVIHKQARRKNCWGSHWLLSSSASSIGNETWPFGSCMGVGHIHRNTKEIRDNWKTYYTKCNRNFYAVASENIKKNTHQRVTFKYLPGFESTKLVYVLSKSKMSCFPSFYSCYNHRGRIKQRNKKTSKQIENIQQNSLREVRKEKKAKHLPFLKSGGPSIWDNVWKSWTEYLPLNEVQSFYYYFRLNAFYYWIENAFSNLKLQ